MSILVSVEKATRWYGQVIGVNNITLQAGEGVTGLLGPNGAGKSTLMKLITGHILPNQGCVKVGDTNPFFDHIVKQRMGYVPETEALPDHLTGEAFLRKRAYLRGYSSGRSKALAAKYLSLVDLEEARAKKIGAYSKGMRQRLKLAQALLHDPEALILDEPLTGLDPVGRHQVIRLIKSLGQNGRTVLVSSHVLHEIELMTDQVIMIARGKILAEGTIEHIRSLIDAHPHTVDLTVTNPHDLAVCLLNEGCVVSVSLENGEGHLRIKTREPDRFYDVLGTLVIDKGFQVERFNSPDNNLQAVFDYLVK